MIRFDDLKIQKSANFMYNLKRKRIEKKVKEELMKQVK
jgi:hypothetical protein